MDWYPRFPAKFDRDTIGLSLAASGAYSKLIDFYMLTEEALPDNDAVLAGILRVAMETWLEVAPAVRSRFRPIDGRLHDEACDNAIARFGGCLGGNHSAWRRLRLQVIAEDGATCTYCGEPADPPTVDHIVPRAQGGASVRKNLCVACRPCNSSKGARTPEEWRGRDG